MAFYGYIRTSSGRQANSEAAQERILCGMAMAEGGELAAIFHEKSVSGSIPIKEREAGGELLRAAKKGDVILAVTLDRLFRSASDALTTLDALTEKGVRVIMKDIGDTSSTNGRLLLTIIAAFAQAEREMAAERIRTVKQMQTEEGRYLGGKLPFGHVRDHAGKLLLTAEGALQRAEMKRLRDEGKSLRAVAEIMAAQGVKLSHTGVRDAIAAEEEAQNISEQVNAVKQSQTPTSRYLGGRLPFGYERGEDGGLVLTPDGVKAREDAEQMRAEGKSLRAIAAEMQARGFNVTHTGIRTALGETQKAVA